MFQLIQIVVHIYHYEPMDYSNLIPEKHWINNDNVILNNIRNKVIFPQAVGPVNVVVCSRKTA